MAMVVAAIATVGLLLIIAAGMALLDRRRRRKSKVQMAGWLERSGQAATGNSAVGYLEDVKGVGSTYSADQLREGDKEKPPTD